MGEQDCNIPVQGKKQHSIKVPSIYKEASAILKKYKNGEGSLKNLIYGGVKYYPHMKKLLAILTKVVANYSVIENALKGIKFFDEQKLFHHYLAIVLAQDILERGEQLRSPCTPIVVMNSYEEKLRNWFGDNNARVEGKKDISREDIVFPRYVRINTILNSAKYVEAQLKELGWYREEYDPNQCSYDDFLLKAKNISENSYMHDYHVPNLLLFSTNQEFWQTELYKQELIALQDKASCLPSFLSGVSPGDVALDACAAPGNKSSHLVALMKNKGRVIANDMNLKRFETLNSFLEKRGATCAETLNCDFLYLNPSEYQDVKVILVDPSCSSSGTTVHTDLISRDRLERLSSFQLKLLIHALSFPNVETVVYSTCSVTNEENEDVVREALAEVGSTFVLEDLGQRLPGWKHFGHDSYDFGSFCIRTDPKVDLCQGFFVAKFRRKTVNGSTKVTKNKSTEKRKFKQNESANTKIKLKPNENANKKIKSEENQHAAKKNKNIKMEQNLCIMNKKSDPNSPTNIKVKLKQNSATDNKIIN